jgi:C1A family cysteine protease
MAVAGNAANAAPPPAVDLRPAFTNWGLALRLQGGRGTCSVFTMTGAIEFALATRQHCGTPLSVEFLNWASNEVTHEADDGSFFSDLWTGFSTHGICVETNMPYEAKFDTNRRPSEVALQQAREPLKAGLRFHWIKPWDVKTGLTEAHFNQIKETLAKQWPVCGGFRWPKEERWKDGVLEMRPPEGVFDGHSVLLIGFRDDPQQPGGGVFLIRNSGKGDKDAAMSYEYVRAYMNDAAWVEAPLSSMTNDEPRMTKE